jgi:hypothetical protein
VIVESSRRNRLKSLKAKFAQEARRNLFDAFVGPSETLIKFIATSASSSAAFPRGEALRFVFSSHGQTLLVLNSARIFVVDLLAEPLAVTRELKTIRRPVSAAITNDGAQLAVLSTKHQTNVYGLTAVGITHLRVITLDNPPRTISLADQGTVLAAAYEGGVEVFSLAANALSTDRRAVRCEAVDSLSFSSDGSMLIGSSHDTEDSNTVILSAPFYTENDPDVSTSVLHSRMWTTQILFPQNSSTCNHATLLNAHSESDINWLFVYDRLLNTYRAVRSDDTRTGVAYFLGPNTRGHDEVLPNMLPSVNLSGDLAVAGYSGAGLVLYGIPERIDHAPDMSHVLKREERSTRKHPLSLTSATGCREPLMAYSPPVSETETIEDDFLSGSVDWRQSLFVRGRQLATMHGAVGAAWVENPKAAATTSVKRRLAVVAPGGVNDFANGIGEEVVPVDGGRVLLLDFDYGPQRREKRTMTIEVGESTPETLPEQRRNLEAEVAILRRRSIQESIDGSRRLSLGHSLTTLSSPTPRMSTHIEDGGSRRSLSQPSSPVEALRQPDGIGSRPRGVARSRESIYRSATAMGIDRARYPPRSPLDQGQVIASEHGAHWPTNNYTPFPHEVDASHWQLPPPYSRNADQVLPHAGPSHMIPGTFTGPPNRLGEPVTPPPRASTMSGEMNASPVSSMYPQSPSDRDMSRRRRRGFSESTLGHGEDVAQWQQARRRSEHFSSLGSLGSSVSPLPSSRNIWSLGRHPSESSTRMAPNIISPVNARHPQLSPQEIAAYYAARFPPVVMPSLQSIEEPAPRLTGANLQNRLNHPVPPRPFHLNQAFRSTYVPSTLPVGTSGFPSAVQSTGTGGHRSFCPPTANQVAGLDERVSGTRNHRPTPISTSSARALGVSGPLPFKKAGKPSRPRSRSTSRGSTGSGSAPKPATSRPRFDRLNTIDSVGAAGRQEEQPMRKSGFLMDRIALSKPLPQPGHHTTATDGRGTRSRKQRRADKESSNGSRDGKKRRTNRCVVM